MSKLYPIGGSSTPLRLTAFLESIAWSVVESLMQFCVTVHGLADSMTPYSLCRMSH